MEETTTARGTKKVQAQEVTGPDLSKPGWPERCPTPFVSFSWYDQFKFPVPPALNPRENPVPGCRPKIRDGHGGNAQMTMDEAEYNKRKWTEESTHITLINMDWRSHTTQIAGSKPGELLWVDIPAFGVVRGPVDILLKVKNEGEALHRFHHIAPVGDCKREHSIAAPDPDGNPVDGKRLESCKYYGCPQHPMEGCAHTIQQAYHWIAALGQPHPDKQDPKHRARYIPMIEQSIKQLDKYLEVDRRMLVGSAISLRQNTLRRRDARLRQALNSGRAIAGY